MSKSKARINKGAGQKALTIQFLVCHSAKPVTDLPDRQQVEQAVACRTDFKQLTGPRS